MGFVEAVRDLAQQAGLTVPEEAGQPGDREEAARQKQKQLTLSDVLARAAEGYRRQLKASDRAIAYLKGRGLSGEVAARFGLGYASDGWRGLASVFPSYDDPLLEESGLVIAHDGDPPSGDGDEGAGKEALRPLPRPDHVSDPLGPGRGDRLRRPRPRPRRAEIPQLARDAGLQQGPRAVRPVRGAHRDPPARLRARRRGLHGRRRPRPGRLRERGGDARHRVHGRARAKAGALHRLGRLQLRRRRRRPARRRSRPGGEPAARQRHAHLPLPLPARRARPRQLRSRARRRGVRAGDRRGGAAVAPDPRPRRRRRRPRDRRRAGALPRQRSPALVGAARRHAQAPAARRGRVARRIAGRRARRRLARDPTGRRDRRARHALGAAIAYFAAPPRRAASRCASRPTASPGCCCSRAAGGRR